MNIFNHLITSCLLAATATGAVAAETESATADKQSLATLRIEARLDYQRDLARRQHR